MFVDRVLSSTQLHPESATTQLSRASVSYFLGGPPVLKNISFSATPGEKIDVGRTGTRKSSVTACLLRMPANTDTIIIEGICMTDLKV